ncbi:MAG: translocation/assembly module TamB domain-containing protein [Bacteroidales bacterium]|nr:translocation/assembly module TamB domain-containing protein [Bacteroidales bacterium]
MQTSLARKATRMLSEQAGAEISVDRIAVRLSGAVSLHELYAGDLSGDTMLYVETLHVDLRLLPLFRNKLHIKQFDLSGAVINLTRMQPDTLFNYDFLVDVFSGEQGDSHPESRDQRADANTDSPAGWQMRVNTFNLSNIRVRFADHFAGLDVTLRLDALHSGFDVLDPDHMVFMLGDTRISDADISLFMHEASVQKDKDAHAPAGIVPKVGVSEFLLENLSFAYADDADFSIQTALSHLAVRPRMLDLERQYFDLESFVIDGFFTEILTVSVLPDESPLPVYDHQPPDAGHQFSLNWEELMPVSVVADLFRINDAGFVMRETIRAENDTSLDQKADLSFSDLSLFMEDVFLTNDSIHLKFMDLGGKQEGGLELKSLSGKLAIGKGARIENLSIRTAESALLNMNLSTSVPLLKVDWPVSANHTVDISLPAASLGGDVLALAGAVGTGPLFEDGSLLELELQAGGRINDVTLKKLLVHSGTDFRAEIADAAIKGLPDPDQLFFDVSAFALTANPYNLGKMLPEGLIPAGLHLPGELALDAVLKGYLNDFFLDADVHSDLAALEGTLSYRQASENQPEWNVSMHMTSDVPLAVVGDDETIRNVGLSLSASGTGFDVSTMSADGRLVLDSITFNNYSYKELIVNASAANGKILAEISSEDEHLSLRLNNSLDLAAEFPHIVADWHIKNLNALELGFTDQLIAMQGRIMADVCLSSPDFFDGKISIFETHVLLEREVFSMDSLIVTTSSSPGHFTAGIRSPMLEASYNGNISPVAVPSALAQHLNTYLNRDLFRADGSGKHKKFRLSAKLMPSPYYTELLLPQLHSFEPISIEASFESESRVLSLLSDVPSVQYMDWTVEGLLIEASSIPEALDFSLQLPSLVAEPINITNIAITGHLEDRETGFKLSFDDSNQQAWLSVSGHIRQHKEHTTVLLDPEMLVNRKQWQVFPENYIRIGSDYVLVNNLQITSSGKEITVSSRDTGDPYAPLEFRLRGIDFGEFDLIGGQPLIGGLFNGDVIVEHIATQPSFLADLTIDGLAYMGDTIGDLSLKVDQAAPDLFYADASLRGFGNVLDIKGFYRQDDVPFVDFEVYLEQLDLSTLEALTFEQLTDLEGIISGALQITGPPSNPDISGAVLFNQLGFHVSFLNAYYRITDAALHFDRNTLRFDRFSLTDRGGRQASLDGTVNFADLSDIRLDLSLLSSDFLLMDIPKGHNELFYGRLLLDTELAMGGSLAEPLIEGRLKLNQGSSFAFIVPQVTPEAIGDEGVVEFFSIRDELFADLLLLPDEEETLMSVFSNLIISVNVEVDPQTLMTIIVDEHSGDFLEIRGGGLISYGVDPGGRISLSGRYEISEGAYQMTFYEVIRRNFSIESGSNIVWTGDPLKARVDITARHTVRTSANELLSTQTLPGDVQQTGHRRLYPFDVYLNMEGELLQPDIRFELGLPPEHRGAMEGRLQSRLDEINQNESELNKQVFALLILGNFIQDDPLAAMTAGPGITSTARSSASRLLSQQLNILSERYIRGVDLSFEVESFEEYENGQLVGRTELQMEVSRDFFDERLRITAGGHIELEDETRRQLNPADIAGDFSIEYLLLPDGRLILRAYRERRFQDVFEGELVETGISLKFRQSFNRFRELFRREETSSNSETLNSDQ